MRIDQSDRYKARAAIVAWAASPGFAAVHNGNATHEAITDNLIAWLRRAGFEITPRRVASKTG